MTEVVAQHRFACDGFGRAVSAAAGRWGAPSPCSEWDARGVVEHVIGFHDVLLLKPLGAKPTRPKDDPPARWSLTVDALFSALASPGAVDAERESLLGVLTTEVLIHTWDLSRAIGIDVLLDAQLCELGYERVKESQDRLAASEMFAAPVPVALDASAQDRLLALFGRDPGWMPPST
jgi:uncharacterized protein (TIGR03086 family)